MMVVMIISPVIAKFGCVLSMAVVHWFKKRP